jgi:hypothetical protein
MQGEWNSGRIRTPARAPSEDRPVCLDADGGAERHTAVPETVSILLGGSEPGHLTLITDAPLVAPIKKAAPLLSLAHIADSREMPYVEVSSSRYSVERTSWETRGNSGNPFFR